MRPISVVLSDFYVSKMEEDIVPTSKPFWMDIGREGRREGKRDGWIDEWMD